MNCLLVSAFLLPDSSFFLVEDLSQTVVFGFILFEFIDDLRTCADSDVLNKLGILFVENIVLSFQLFDLIFIAELSLHKQGLTLLLFIRYQPCLLLELRQHFFIIFPLFRQLLPMSFTHVLHDLFKLLNFEDSFVSFEESSL